MKTLLLLVLVAVGVSGCVVSPYGHHHGGAYRYDGASRSYRPAPQGYDQNRDGIPDRQPRDSDRDGVPDRWDAQPSDPRRR